MGKILTQRRSGAVLVLSVFFFLASFIMIGFVIDISRVLLAENQLAVVADSIGISVVNNFKVASYQHSSYGDNPHYEKVRFIARSGISECWFEGWMNPQKNMKIWLPNSQFPDRNGQPFVSPPEGTSPTNTDCVTMDDIKDVYLRLALSTYPLQRSFGLSTNPWHFNPESVNVRLEYTDESDVQDASVKVFVDAEVDLVFAKILHTSLRSWKIRATNESAITIL